MPTRIPKPRRRQSPPRRRERQAAWFLRRRQAGPLGAAARVVAERAPRTLTVARHRAQPTAVTIIRLTSTAVFAYLLALVLITTSRPVLAPLTALLVVQVSLYQTLRSVLTKVASVVAGVLLAVGLSASIGFTWWSLALTIAVGLVIGYVLRLGDNILEVPVSAMLILAVGSRAAAVGRVEETFIGAGAGLAAGFVLTSPRVQSAEEAIEDLCGKLADLLDRVTAGLRDGSVLDSAGEWLRQARSIGSEIRRVDEAVGQAVESVKFNPRGLRLPFSTVSLRVALETLEHETTAIRVLCRSLADLTRLAGDDNRMHDPEIRGRLAGALREISLALRVYGRLATELDPSRHERLESEQDRHLDAARDEQDRLSELLRTDPAARPVGWPLRGELISNLDRLRIELRTGKPERRTRRRRPSWPRGPRVHRTPRRRAPARRRLMA